MGLKVRVYQNIKLSNNKRDYDFKAYVIDENWEYKIKNLKKGRIYKGDIIDRTISYPYSAHNRFREALIKLINRGDLLKQDGTIRWAELPKDIPFYDFIDFADNEGVLDWEVSNKIYDDFEKFRRKANDFYSESDLTTYLAWLNIFESAKNNGVVVFS